VRRAHAHRAARDAALAAPDAGRSPEERAAASLDRARLREIIAELPRRRQAIVKLRFFFERTPEEIQRYLGITERAYRRELERAMRQIAERYELVRSGAYCDTRRSMILALIAGLAGPNRARDAREHLRSCPGCAHWAAAALDAGRWVLGKALPKVLPKDKTVCNDFGTYELVLRVDQNGKLVLEHGADHTKVGKIGKAPVEPPAQIREEWSVTMPELRNG
jgi:hypothetical protein